MDERFGRKWRQISRFIISKLYTIDASTLGSIAVNACNSSIYSEKSIDQKRVARDNVTSTLLGSQVEYLISVLYPFEAKVRTSTHSSKWPSWCLLWRMSSTSTRVDLVRYQNVLTHRHAKCQSVVQNVRAYRMIMFHHQFIAINRCRLIAPIRAHSHAHHREHRRARWPARPRPVRRSRPAAATTA